MILSVLLGLAQVLTSTRVSWGVYDRFSLPIVLQWVIASKEQNAFHGVYFW